MDTACSWPMSAEEADRICSLVEEEMEGVAALSVPLLAETHAGKSWADAH